MNEELYPPLSRRSCPVCGKHIMALATLCGYCWTKVTPLAGGIDASNMIDAAGPGPEETAHLDALKRSCPTCGKSIMAAATLCGFCWTKLTPAIA